MIIHIDEASEAKDEEEEELDDDEEKVLVEPELETEQQEANELSDTLETTTTTATTTTTLINDSDAQTQSFHERERWHKENDDTTSINSRRSKRSSNTSIISHQSSNKFILNTDEIIIESFMNGLSNGNNDSDLEMENEIIFQNDEEPEDDETDNYSNSEQKLLNGNSTEPPNTNHNVKELILIQLDDSNEDEKLVKHGNGAGLNGVIDDIFTKFTEMGW